MLWLLAISLTAGMASVFPTIIPAISIAVATVRMKVSLLIAFLLC